MSTAAVILATIVRVIDGDTIIINMKECNQPIVCENLSVRIANIDTPELHTKCPTEKILAEQARRVTSAYFPVGAVMPLNIIVGSEKYGRLMTTHKILEEALLTQGLAVPYHGEKKSKDWCGIYNEAP